MSQGLVGWIEVGEDAMCEFCVQHGEGKKWYLQANNYSRDLLNCERIHYAFDIVNNLDTWGVNWARELDKVIATDPLLKDQYIAKRTKYFKRVHYGQVIPLEDLEKVIDMTSSVIRLPVYMQEWITGPI